MNINLLRQAIRVFSRADFSRSSGPGGQNVNKVNTKVTLRIRVDDLAGLNNAETARLREVLASRITTNNEIIITSSEERSRRINLERAFSRMENIIVSAAKLPVTRRPTKPSRAAREQRLRSKHLRAIKKKERHFRMEE